MTALMHLYIIITMLGFVRQLGVLAVVSGTVHCGFIGYESRTWPGTDTGQQAVMPVVESDANGSIPSGTPTSDAIGTLGDADIPSGPAPYRLGECAETAFSGAHFPWELDFSLTTLGDGRVLLLGGQSGSEFVDQAELFIPSTGEWDTLPPMPFAVGEHTATYIPEHNAVLVTGGGHGFLSARDHAALLDVSTRSWHEVEPMAFARVRHRATRLASGQILVCGGSFDAPTDAARSCQRFIATSASTGAWGPAADLPEGRYNHVQHRLQDGSVLVTHGMAISSAASSRYLPGSDAWEPLPNSATWAEGHLSVLLHDGSVLITGGWHHVDGSLRRTKRFDGATEQWEELPDAPRTAIDTHAHKTARLADGRVVFEHNMHFDSTSDTWELVPEPSHEACVALHDEAAVFCVGGDDVDRAHSGRITCAR